MDPEQLSTAPALSAESTRQLHEALEKHALLNDASALEPALAALCREARARNVSAAAIVLAMRAAWGSVRQPDSATEEGWSRAYYAALSTCLSYYFELRA